MDKEIIDAVRKKAVGYTVTERVEEQQNVDGELQVTKVKISTKDVPPDIQAVKCLIDIGEDKKVEDMTIEELNEEKSRLLRLLKENENGTD